MLSWQFHFSKRDRFTATDVDLTTACLVTSILSAPRLGNANDYDICMDDRPTEVAADRLGIMLHRSDELHEALLHLLDGGEFDSSPRGQAAFGMCSVALEHGLSLRSLIAMGLATSATGLMRLQFEALTRAMWLLFAASDHAIEKLTAPLTTESEQAAKNVPSATEMIEQIGKRVGLNAPAAAHQMLVHFKDVSWHALNSYVHGGIHPLRRHTEGFPTHLVIQILQNSNALLTMTAMTLATLTGDEAITRPLSKIQPAFADCLPELLK